MPIYRDCTTCDKTHWNVSRIDPGPDPYICPVCEYRQKLRDRQRRKAVK